MPEPAPTRIELSATQNLTRNLERLATKKIWLPRLLYAGLPYFYLAAGLVSFFAALYISEWFWVVPQYLLFSAACLHLAFAVYRRRRRAAVSAQTDLGSPAGADKIRAGARAHS